MGIGGMIGTRLGGYGTDKFGVDKMLLATLTVHRVALLMSHLNATTATGAYMMVMLWEIFA
ncbi:hypothetical protein P9578_19045 [Brevibacillus choshinensis]|uniref:hypothetical protein n=1 Tax=Brevibacillus choshinensis TaxID=54911 RepID=UPI002E207741|nr:hypothetical protein [Brevibacillus choshinensis]